VEVAEAVEVAVLQVAYQNWCQQVLVVEVAEAAEAVAVVVLEQESVEAHLHFVVAYYHLHR
jgi:hypothetical protein